jgi:hypothetical protein
MSVESWQQGQSGQRQRTIIASGTANGAISDNIFAEPRTATPTAKEAGAPPDASNKPKPKANAPKEPASPSKPSKGE